MFSISEIIRMMKENVVAEVLYQQHKWYIIMKDGKIQFYYPHKWKDDNSYGLIDGIVTLTQINLLAGYRIIGTGGDNKWD